jgi:phosphoribosylformimino-5-aminoimidazole carboxamide ribotide isomerase
MSDFILFPAIDLKDGAGVRLREGDMATATIYAPDPAAQARRFAEAGTQWLHVVDLNGAFAGKAVNADAVQNIRQSFPGKMQLGGGIRDRAGIDRWISLGVDRIVLGTAALKSPDLVKQAARDLPAQIVVAVDARDGFVAPTAGRIFLICLLLIWQNALRMQASPPFSSLTLAAMAF